VADESRFCSSCGEAIESPTSAPTETSLKSEPRAGSHPTSDQARFIPGTILAKRYRIISLLGRGGMGEVYRADDLKLGQPVALKFLPGTVQRDQTRFDRFLNEAKTALKVTHPNVCRVHDIGEVDGQRRPDPDWAPFFEKAGFDRGVATAVQIEK
jgi:serine/threonine-protein kinase